MSGMPRRLCEICKRYTYTARRRTGERCVLCEACHSVCLAVGVDVRVHVPQPDRAVSVRRGADGSRTEWRGRVCAGTSLPARGIYQY